MERPVTTRMPEKFVHLKQNVPRRQCALVIPQHALNRCTKQTFSNVTGIPVCAWMVFVVENLFVQNLGWILVLVKIR